MATYSLAITGALADSPNLVTNITLPDTSAQVGGQANAAMVNTQMLCKNVDGSQSWYTIDAERSIPGVSRVLKRV